MSRVFLVAGSNRQAVCWLLLIVLIAGAGSGIFLLHLSYPLLAAETRRYQVIKAELGGEAPSQAAVLFLGNSVVMNGVDGGHFSQRASGHPEAMNLATPGQDLVETLLILENIRCQPAVVYYGVTCEQLTRKLGGSKIDTINAYLLYGYRCSERTQRMLGKMGTESRWVEQLGKSEVEITMEARGVVRSSIDGALRRVLRPDLALQSKQADLFYPNPYTRQVTDKQLKTLARRYFSKRTRQDALISERTLTLLRAIKEHLSAAGISFRIVVMPDHPRWRAITEDGFYQAMGGGLKKFGDEQDVEILDAHDLLGEEGFADHFHPYGEGSRRLTDFLAQTWSSAKDTSPK